MEFPRLRKEIFEKNAKNRMRVPWAVKIHSASMKTCVKRYRHKISDRIPVDHFGDALTHITLTNRWIDVMNGSSSGFKGCESINDVDHSHVYELLSYVTYLKTWKDSVHSDNFLPNSAYTDCVHTSLGVVLTARIYLPKWADDGYPDESIAQRRHGTDDVEKLFCKSRGGNANADTKGTNNMCSGTISGVMNDLAQSKKANCGKQKTYDKTELGGSKIQRKKFKM